MASKIRRIRTAMSTFYILSPTLSNFAKDKDIDHNFWDSDTDSNEDSVKGEDEGAINS